MYPSIHTYLTQCLAATQQIPNDRIQLLRPAVDYVRQKIQTHTPTHLLFVCTHNSRRSHMGQVWSALAAAYFQLPHILTYSAGTEVTACHPNTLHALQSAGLRITREENGTNPFYHLKYSDTHAPLLCFSKTYHDPSIPKYGLAAIMTCTDADENCPVIEGSEIRVSCPYADPKVYDQTVEQDQQYAERCFQIATEWIYVMQQVKQTASII